YKEDEGDTAVDDLTSFKSHVELAQTLHKFIASMIMELTAKLDIPQLSDTLQQLLFHQQNPSNPHDPDKIPLITCPLYDSQISVFNSASATFHISSHISGIIGGMHHEYICSSPLWRNESPHYNCTFVSTSSEIKAM
ncbi:hypothetical protein PAXRUDRAFT_172198, partial [Paxillus rubicundulus Ve08.2h10]